MWIDEDSKEFLFAVVVVVLSVIILTVSISLPITRISSWSIQVERDAIQQTVDASRNSEAGVGVYESAAITNKIINFNQGLASAQYYESLPFFGWWYWSGIRNIKPVK